MWRSRRIASEWQSMCEKPRERGDGGQRGKRKNTDMGGNERKGYR